MALGRLLAAVLLAFSAGRAVPSDFFGPSQGLQIQPELDVYQGFSGEEFRLIAKVLPVFIPSQSYCELGAGLYAAWLVAPLASGTITPNLAKRRSVDLRLGVEWYPAFEEGRAGASDVVQVEAEGTPRLLVPGKVLASLRNRVDARWQLAYPTSFAWRLRFRLQLEREFPVSDTASLTPYANGELIWSTAKDMWDQFRMQAGLQLGVYWFGKGQVIEVNTSVVTYLQPNRSYSPVIGAVWQQFF